MTQDNFDAATRAVIGAASVAARDCGHRQIGLEHLVVGLLAVPGSGPAEALAGLGLTPAAVSARVAALDLPRGPLAAGPDMLDQAACAALRAASLDAALLTGGPADPAVLTRCVLAAGHPGVGAALGPRVTPTDVLVQLDRQPAVSAPAS